MLKGAYGANNELVVQHMVLCLYGVRHVESTMRRLVDLKSSIIHLLRH